MIRQLKKLAFGILVNMGALWAISLILDGFQYAGGWVFLVIAGILIGALNTLVKPIIKLLSFPLVFFSAGLFLIIINAAMLAILDYVLEVMDFTGIDLQVEGTLTYLWAAIIFGLVNWLENWILKK
ncbi:MAG: hypothetical protein UV80_C0002G0258 [Candidatus Peregrinibacteria bacterium GW2011_GWF2_43_17]|nr:MAG: hypothetical protein UV80_C0002G0258 [Candidatus Peregrinibacteria bacterium GW2011_GWF2_43_17]KKT18638.1 MAG: hypothetical protein UW03_C0036G0010 [Candidatus Peregrinibacteria bacterium GW2011_GWA2_43_8]HAU39701.1 hypothetical protein [Candidatus Peregrinibacteria bacterium]